MADVTQQPWFDDTKTADENIILMNDYLIANYDIYNLSTGVKDLLLEFTLVLAAMKREEDTLAVAWAAYAESRVDAINAPLDAALATQDAAIIDWGLEAQARIAAGYDMTPEFVWP